MTAQRNTIQPEAIRFSGSVRIELAWSDHLDSYTCRLVRAENGRNVVARLQVGAPAANKLPVDSEEAFDSAAHAALSFADDMDREWGEAAESAESGWQVSREGA